MLCYLDKTFCNQPCANADCSRNFNDDVMAHARAWWGTEGTPPIDFADMRTDDCGFVPVYKRRMPKSKKDLERVEWKKELSSINTKFSEE